MFNKIILLVFTFTIINVFSQKKDIEKLDEITITSNRIEVPFSKVSKKITIISAEQIKQSAATNLTDLLQNIAGIDVIRRGTNGMQSDIKIRGGNFQQVLILIDGFKTEDPQTGHHTMNMMISLDNIERIEIIKGAAARVYGQNAFSGAINIVTKKISKNALSVNANYGSFGYVNGGASASKELKKSKHFINISHQESDGYRNNTDFKNNNIFIKSSFNTNKKPINIIGSFADRKFGAQYFYTSPASNFTEYEETQTSLIGVSTKLNLLSLSVKPRIYWKRNQDEFLLKRDDPSFSRNHNISNKIGVELNTFYKSKIGTTGFGVDFAKVYLASNNLGDQHRTMINGFVEHRYVTKSGKLDFTPGVAVSYFSDFGFNTFPGLDVGYKMNKKTNLFWNIGSSYRVPTYTEMYINIPNFLSGNENLKPEKAFTQEIGFTHKVNNFNINSSIFYRISNDLIDYVKETSVSSFYKAQNLRTIKTKGLEFNVDYKITALNYKQTVSVGYTYLKDDYEDVAVFKSRYLLNNTMKHHLTASFQTQFFKNIKQNVSYRYVEKPFNKYHIVDAKITANIYKFDVFVLANNILDTAYFEKEFVQMPKSNFEVGVKYNF